MTRSGCINCPSRSALACNVDGFDRGLRIGIGLLVLAWTLADGLGLRTWGVGGLALLLTGLLQWCPAYVPVGFSTCRRGAAPK